MPYTLTYQGEYSSTKTVTPRVNKIAFADGYQQRAPDGLNSIQPEYAMTFKEGINDCDAIDDFLKARGGVDAFYWTPPRKSSPVVVICETWSRNYSDAGYDSISATFKEVPDYLG